MPLRPCLGSQRNEPGHTLTAHGSRCQDCRGDRQRTKDARRPERRSYAEQQRRRQVVAEHVAAYGWLCPGAPDLRHDPHPSRDLTADHIGPVAQGGTEDGPLRVLCRSKNSERGATARRTP